MGGDGAWRWDRCVAMGLGCPLLMVPVLPDMHACRRPARVEMSEQQAQDATNLISSLYTTMMNLGGVVGPWLGAVGIESVGFSTTVGLLGLGHVAIGLLLSLWLAGSWMHDKRRGERASTKLYEAVKVEDDEE
jgi:predicted MFS family arabinose efflux permease